MRASVSTCSPVRVIHATRYHVAPMSTAAAPVPLVAFLRTRTIMRETYDCIGDNGLLLTQAR